MSEWTTVSSARKAKSKGAAESRAPAAPRVGNMTNTPKATPKVTRSGVSSSSGARSGTNVGTDTYPVVAPVAEAPKPADGMSSYPPLGPPRAPPAPPSGFRLGLGLSSKPKPTITKTVALFDLVFKNKEVVTPSTQKMRSSNIGKSSSSHTSSKEDVAADLEQKQAEAKRAWLQKKKLERQKVQKKFSSLKKKVLLERMNRQKKLNTEIDEASNDPASLGMGHHADDNDNDVVVVIANFVNFGEIFDDDEREAIERDIRDIVALQAGALLSVTFTLDTASAEGRDLPSISGDSPEHYSSECVVVLTFTSSESALATRRSLHNLVVGGRVLRCCVCSAGSVQSAIEKVLTDSSASLMTPSAAACIDSGDDAASASAIIDSTVAAILVIENLIFAEDVTDEDEAAETLADVRSLLSVDDSSIHSLWIENMATAAAARVATATPSPVDARRTLPLMLLEVEGARMAYSISTSLQGMRIASRPLSTFLCDYDCYLRGDYTESSLVDITAAVDTIFCVRLFGFIDNWADDEDERAEIEADIREQSRLATGGDSIGVVYVNSGDSGAVDVIIAAGSFRDALSIYEFFNRRTFAGAAIVAGIVSIDSGASVDRLLKTSGGRQNGLLSQLEWEYATRSRLLCGSKGSYSCPSASVVSAEYSSARAADRVVIAVTNYSTEDDMLCDDGGYKDSKEHYSSFSDEIVELKTDLLALARRHSEQETIGSASEGYIRRVALACSGGRDSSAAPGSSDSLYACVGFTTIDAAEVAMLAIDGMYVGGLKLKAALTRTMPGVAAAAAVSPENASQTIVRAHVASPPDKGADSDDDTGGGKGGKDSGSGAAIRAEEENQDAAAAAVNIYAAAKLAAKLPSRQLNVVYPSLPFISPVTDVHIEEALKALLKALSGFQARLKENEPLKFKQKMRFVSGLKQCTNGIRSGRALLVLLASDTEESDALDDRVGTMVAAAAERGVPVVICLNRRRLGKAVDGKSATRQAAVAVYSADGAYEHYSKLLKELHIERS